MEYSINKLAKISGVTTRTLRYYDEIALLRPARVAASGYRMYGPKQVDTLQQILLFRELGFALADIKRLLSAPEFDRAQAFAAHLTELQAKRERLDTLIRNVTKSQAVLQKGHIMADQEKFEGFKQELIDKNEQAYGEEVRAKYGDKAMDESNAKLKGLTQAQYQEGERLRVEFESTLKAAFEAGDPAAALAQKACDLHRQWLSVYYPKYSKEYHRGLAEMYVADERFKANYEKLGTGCTEFLRDAIKIYCA